MRTAFFGGTFDPPHRGHAAIATAAADAFELDRVLFAPVGRQPLKSQPVTGFDHRLAMTALLCAGDPRFFLSDLDAPSPTSEPNFTVDTLARLRIQAPGDTLFALAGADSFSTLAQWREPSRLLSLAEWIVVSRPGFSLDQQAPGVAADPPGITLTSTERGRIHLLDSVHEDVAATNLRERLRTGDPCTDLLTPSISTYIRTHHLYLPPPGAPPSRS